MVTAESSYSNTSDGDYAIAQFTDHYPEKTNVGHFYNGLTPQGYDEWARRVNFCEPYKIVDEVARIASEGTASAPLRMLDCGAGTGLLGLKLHEKGVTNLKIQGCDASTQFVEVLTNSDHYEEAREVWLGNGVENFPGDYKGVFDICTASGTFLKGHMPARAIEDIHAALKPNGHFVTAMRQCYWAEGNEEGYREKLDEMVAAGKLRLLNTSTFMRGVEGEQGLFAPQESRLLCYQKCE